MSKYQDMNATLAYLFTKFMAEHPTELAAIPNDALVIMQIEGYRSFNRWSKEMSLSAPDDKERPVVYAVFRFNPAFTPSEANSKRLVTSEVEDLQLQPA